MKVKFMKTQKVNKNCVDSYKFQSIDKLNSGPIYYKRSWSTGQKILWT